MAIKQAAATRLNPAATLRMRAYLGPAQYGCGLYLEPVQ